MERWRLSDIWYLQDLSAFSYFQQPIVSRGCVTKKQVVILAMKSFSQISKQNSYFIFIILWIVFTVGNIILNWNLKENDYIL